MMLEIHDENNYSKLRELVLLFSLKLSMYEKETQHHMKVLFSGLIHRLQS